MLDFFLELLTGIFGLSSETLNTQKIDKNIEKLRSNSWFEQIYQDETYHRLFFVSRKVRGYLQSSRRVNRIMTTEKARSSFIQLLESCVK